VEQKVAMSANQEAQLAAARARLTGSVLEVNDCVLRAPFDGEVAVRQLDPGAFVRPGNPVATVIDRHLLRLTAEVPEVEFESVAPGQPVKFRSLASGKEYAGVIARRSPLADPDTRTIHFEADVEDPKHELPVGSTAEIEISVGQPVPAVSLPSIAASIRGGKATLFEITQDTAHQKTVEVIGESNGQLFVDPGLGAGAQIVTEGRALLKEGARVAMAEEKAP
jgi:RND family efflux transporter MFP subunit